MIRTCEHGAALHFLRRQTSHELESQSQVPTYPNRAFSELSSVERIGLLAAGISMLSHKYPHVYAIIMRNSYSEGATYLVYINGEHKRMTASAMIISRLVFKSQPYQAVWNN